MAFFAAMLVGCLMFWLEGHKGLNLSDEGFLWYGAQQVVHGSVPVRDFMSYDIGRYYWCAALMQLSGNTGLVTLRLAIAAFACLTVAIASWLVVTDSPLDGRRFRLWITAGVVSALFWMWMVPRHKTFDIGMSVVLVFALWQLIRRPKASNHFVFGLLAGLAGTIGRNHFFYALASLAMASAMLWRCAPTHESWKRALASVGAGVFLGYLPVSVLLMTDHSFTQQFIRDIDFLLFHYNAPRLPIPWPWLALHNSHVDWQALAAGTGYIVLLAFDVIGSIVLVIRAIRKQSIDPLFAACVIASVMYTHHGLSRASAGYVPQAILPFVIFALRVVTDSRLSLRYRLSISSVLLACTMALCLPMHPAFACYHNHWTKQKVHGDMILVDTPTAYVVNEVGGVIQKYAATESFLVAPYWPTFYAIFERRAPMHDIYPLFERTPEWQSREIAQLETARPRLAILVNTPLDDDKLRTFARNNSLVYDYIRHRFQMISVPFGAKMDLSVYVSSN